MKRNTARKRERVRVKERERERKRVYEGPVEDGGRA